MASLRYQVLQLRKLLAEVYLSLPTLFSLLFLCFLHDFFIQLYCFTWQLASKLVKTKGARLLKTIELELA